MHKAVGSMPTTANLSPSPLPPTKKLNLRILFAIVFESHV
jgi:hypothetical protein